MQPAINHNRIARSAILNGVSIPPATVAVLESRGVNVGELELRLREAVEFRR
jgi:hypothetical protein